MNSIERQLQLCLPKIHNIQFRKSRRLLNELHSLLNSLKSIGARHVLLAFKPATKQRIMSLVVDEYHLHQSSKRTQMLPFTQNFGGWMVRTARGCSAAHKDWFVANTDWGSESGRNVSKICSEKYDRWATVLMLSPIHNLNTLAKCSYRSVPGVWNSKKTSTCSFGNWLSKQFLSKIAHAGPKPFREVPGNKLSRKVQTYLRHI